MSSGSSSSTQSSSSSPLRGPYCINLKCMVDPPRREEFLSLVKDNQRLTLQEEPEALQYVVGEDVSQQNTFYIHEQFTSQQGFLAHKETQHNAKWSEFRSTNPFVADPVVHFYYAKTETNNDGEKHKVVPIREAYCVDVELNIDASHRQEFLQVIQNNARGSNEEEPLCLQYEWGECTSTENRFYFHEEYIGQEGFDAHAQTLHFAKWEAFAAQDPFTKPPIVNFYKTLPIIN